MKILNIKAGAERLAFSGDCRRPTVKVGLAVLAPDAATQTNYISREIEIMKRSRVIAALGALAQDTRLDIFRLLVQKGPEGLAAGAIGERVKQQSPTLSFHLNQLRFANLVTSQRVSRS